MRIGCENMPGTLTCQVYYAYSMSWRPLTATSYDDRRVEGQVVVSSYPSLPVESYESPFLGSDKLAMNADRCKSSSCILFLQLRQRGKVPPFDWWGEANGPGWILRAARSVLSGAKPELMHSGCLRGQGWRLSKYEKRGSGASLEEATLELKQCRAGSCGVGIPATECKECSR